MKHPIVAQRRWFNDYMQTHGPMPANIVTRAAARQGINENTLKRFRKQLDIKVFEFWCLPEDVPKT